MPTIQEVETQIAKLDAGSKRLGKKEIKELPNILGEGEDILDIIQGTYNNGLGILVATSRRLIFVDKGMFSLKVEDFPLDKISSIQYKTGMLFGEISIATSGNNAEIKNADKKQVRPFAEGVRLLISKAEGKTAAPATTDIVGQISKLAELKEKGILSEEEFIAAKARLIGG